MRLPSWQQGGPTCDCCQHVHLDESICYNPENREHLCGCTGSAESAVNLCDEKESSEQEMEA